MSDLKMITCGLTLLLLMLRVCKGQETFDNDIKYCGGNPADLIFVMDSSGSIDPGAFVKQKEFVKAMIDLFDINSGKIRVGVVSYSNWAFLEFHLNTYTTKEEMKNAISNVTHYRGDTNTGSTIGYMRDVMFRAEHGARPDVPRIAIVLTDGRSNDPLYTMKESELTRKAGVTLFAIGVGDDASTYELSRIASNPDKNYVFKVENYDALIKIRELLAIKACGVPPPDHVTSWTVPNFQRTTPQPIVIIEEACKGVEYADIVLATAPASSPENSNKTLTFFKDLVNGLDLSNGKLQVGMVPIDCNPIMERLENTAKMTQEEILDTIDKYIKSQTYTADIIKFMRKHSFTRDKGSRKTSKKMGVLIVDNDDILTRSKVEALKAKNFGDIELFVIAVGPDVNIVRLAKIASQATEDHLFHVNSYDELASILPRVQNSICPPSEHSNTLR